MAWNVTLEVSRCDAATTFLAGVGVSSGTVSFGSTDANGRFILVIDDSWDFVILTLAKGGTPGFVTKNLTVTKSVDNGKTIKTCLSEAPPSEPTGTGKPVSCFIVTATTGSAESVEVQQLRQLRDRVGAVTQLGGRLIDVIYDEYAQFSPQIAADLRQNARRREAVLRVVVRPLFAWYTLAGKLALEHADDDEANRAAHDALNACAAYVGGRTIVTLLEAIRAGEPLPAYAPPLLRDLAPRIAQLPFAAWAILDPLVRVWRAAVYRRDVIDEVAEWLAAAPLDAFSPASDAASLEAELAVLADFFAFRPTVRGQFGARLLAAWPDTAPALEHAGFVAAGYREPE